MQSERDYKNDIAEIRSMMERSSKFLSLSGLSGVMAGIYALAGSWVVYHYFDFNPQQFRYAESNFRQSLSGVLITAVVVLILAIGTAMLFSYKKAQRENRQIWNATSRRLISNMAAPLLAGGLLIMLLLSNGFIALTIPLTLIFYGLALYSAANFTFTDIRFLGLIQIVLGLTAVWFIEYGLLIWALGFGIIHIGYGIYMHIRYER